MMMLSKVAGATNVTMKCNVNIACGKGRRELGGSSEGARRLDAKKYKSLAEVSEALPALEEPSRAPRRSRWLQCTFVGTSRLQTIQ